MGCRNNGFCEALDLRKSKLMELNGESPVRTDGMQMKLQADRAFCLEPDVSVSSPATRQKAAAAKQLIENHYKNHLQGLQDRRER